MGSVKGRNGGSLVGVVVMFTTLVIMVVSVVAPSWSAMPVGLPITLGLPLLMTLNRLCGTQLLSLHTFVKLHFYDGKLFDGTTIPLLVPIAVGRRCAMSLSSPVPVVLPSITLSPLSN